MEPYNHLSNASERAIQTFKNHFISSLCIRDYNFTTVLWSYLVRQALDSLNMLRTSRVYPKLSAYCGLEGFHNFNRHPWAPPETKGTIFNPPEKRYSCGARVLDVWYLDTAQPHYICFTFVETATGGINISGQQTLYSQYCTMTTKIPMDEARNIAENLFQAIKKLQNQT